MNNCFEFLQIYISRLRNCDWLYFNLLIILYTNLLLSSLHFGFIHYLLWIHYVTFYIWLLFSLYQQCYFQHDYFLAHLYDHHPRNAQSQTHLTFEFLIYELFKRRLIVLFSLKSQIHFPISLQNYTFISGGDSEPTFDINRRLVVDSSSPFFFFAFIYKSNLIALTFKVWCMCMHQIWSLSI